MKPSMTAGIRIGEWRVEPLLGALIGSDGEEHHLKPKVMDVLVCLAERAGRPVAREELIECVWGERGVAEEVLTKAISELRQALADTSGRSHYIETIPKRGYRLIAPVTTAKRFRTAIPVRSMRPYLLAGFPLLVLGVLLFLRPELIEGDPDALPDTVMIPANSVAVLPFRSQSRVNEDTVFAAGLHDDLVLLLSRLRSLDRVIASASTARYLDTNKSYQEIGRELGVATILTGSLQRVGDTVRINVQLTNASDNTHLWRKFYDRELTVEQIFGAQTEIAREVVIALDGVFPETDEPPLSGYPTGNIDAYREYVLGRAALSRRTGSELIRAREHFENAVSLDPQYAAAWNGLAEAYTLLPAYTAISAESVLDQREAAVNRALAIDPLSGRAYANLAALFLQKGQPEQTEQSFLRALELEPNNSTAHYWYALFLRETGRIELALVHVSKAREIDPLEPIVNSAAAEMYMALRYYDEAESILVSAIERAPEFPSYYASLADLRIRQGRFDQALLLVERALALNPTNSRHNGLRCYLLLNLADEVGVANCTRHVSEVFPDLGNHYLGLYRLFRGEFDEALSMMSQGSAKWELLLYAFNCTLVGRDKDAGEMLSELRPDTDAETTLELDGFATAAAATAIARLLYLDDQVERANEIFDDVLQWRRDPLPVYFAQYIHLTRGQFDLANDALSLAFRRGLFADWWLLRMPVFEPLQADPIWRATLSDIEVEVERQRANYHRFRGDPGYCLTCM